MSHGVSRTFEVQVAPTARSVEHQTAPFEHEPSQTFKALAHLDDIIWQAPTRLWKSKAIGIYMTCQLSTDNLADSRLNRCSMLYEFSNATAYALWAAPKGSICCTQTGTTPPSMLSHCTLLSDFWRLRLQRNATSSLKEAARLRHLLQDCL